MQKWWRGLREAYYEGMNFYESWWGKWYCVLYYIFNGGFWCRLLCKVFGHKLENNGEITPEYGVEQIYCSRCGWSKRIVWF